MNSTPKASSRLPPPSLVSRPQRVSRVPASSRKLPKGSCTPEVDVHNRSRQNAKEGTFVRTGSLSSLRPPINTFPRRTPIERRQAYALTPTSPRIACHTIHHPQNKMLLKTRRPSTATRNACHVNTKGLWPLNPGGASPCKRRGYPCISSQTFRFTGGCSCIDHTEHFTGRANTVVF